MFQFIVVKDVENNIIKISTNIVDDYFTNLCKEKTYEIIIISNDCDFTELNTLKIRYLHYFSNTKKRLTLRHP